MEQEQKPYLPPGIVIDTSPDPSKVFVGCPSIVILVTGEYVASHSWFGPGSTMDTTLVFVSRDKGANWAKVSELKGQFWSTLFVHDDKLYIMGVDSSYGHVVIRQSKESSAHWTEPIDADSGLLLPDTGYHTAPVPVVTHNGRIWRAFEQLRPAAGWCENAYPFVMSAPQNCNLLQAANWTVSTSPGQFNQEWSKLIVDKEEQQNSKASEHPAFNSNGGWLEGNVVVTPTGEIANILRVHEPFGGKTAALAQISSDGKTMTFDPASGFIEFPGGCVKFSIRRDSISHCYYALTNYVHEQDIGNNAERTRNTLGLIVSEDLINWRITNTVLREEDLVYTGFQYVDWQFDGNDIIAVSRTAFGNSDSCHNANYLTFHRFKEFRNF